MQITTLSFYFLKQVSSKRLKYMSDQKSVNSKWFVFCERAGSFCFQSAGLLFSLCKLECLLLKWSCKFVSVWNYIILHFNSEMWICVWWVKFCLSTVCMLFNFSIISTSHCKSKNTSLPVNESFVFFILFLFCTYMNICTKYDSHTM